MPSWCGGRAESAANYGSPRITFVVYIKEEEENPDFHKNKAWTEKSINYPALVVSSHPHQIASLLI